MTKNSITYILLLCLTTAFFNCQKWGDGYVEGHIYENGTNSPIANAKVTFVSPHYSNQGKVLGNVKSDANGYFKIPYWHALSRTWSYYVEVSIDEGYITSKKQNVYNRKEKLEFYFDPVAFVKFHIKNNTANHFDLNIYSENHGSTLSLSGSAYSNQIYSPVLKVKGNGTTNINWDYLNTTYNDNVTINHKNDTIVYTINLN